jgi:hypothetical protein
MNPKLLRVVSGKVTTYFTRDVLPLVIISVAMISSPAQASLVFLGLAPGNGAGIGTTNAILTIQNTPTESGCVSWNGTTSVIGSGCPTIGIVPAIPGGDEGTSANQTQTQTITSTGVRSGSTLTVILNANEPSGNSITVNNLSLTIYDSLTGAVRFNSGNLFGAPITIADTNQGNGNLGFAFQLDPIQAAAANPWITCPSCGANRIGLAAQLSASAGSQEVFSVIDLAPEPYTLLTLVGGLIAIGLLRRFKRTNPAIE